MNNTINITINGKTNQYSYGISGLELSKYSHSRPLLNVIIINIQMIF